MRSKSKLITLLMALAIAPAASVFAAQSAKKAVKAALAELSLTLGTNWSRETLSFTPTGKGLGFIEFNNGKSAKVRREFGAKEYGQWLKTFKDLESKGRRTRDPCQARLFVKVKTNANYASCFDGKPELEREITRAWRKLRGETIKTKKAAN